MLVAGCSHSSQQFADYFSCSPPVATRLDVSIGGRIPPALCFQQDGLVLVVPDCGGCGSDIEMVRSVRRLFGPQEYRPMLIQVRGGTVRDIERDPQLFSRLKP